uniref:Uncharacterized protein n=1 Tax=Arcella intermedia TaxID=1963864 RepID=A0A6B2LF02_9EUKA
MFPSTIILYNLSQEPCLKYDFNLICDRGVNCTHWTSFKLKSTVLFLENFNNRFELSREEFPLSTGFDAYRWAKVLKPFHLTRDLLSKVNVPLPNEYIDIIHQNLDFSDIRWGYDSVIIQCNEYKISKMFWYETHKTTNNNPSESERNSPALTNEDSPNAMSLLNSSPSCDSSSTTVLPVTPAPLNETNDANNHFEKPNPEITNLSIQQIPTF